jgi:hypothetical protein
MGFIGYAHFSCLKSQIKVFINKNMKENQSENVFFQVIISYNDMRPGTKRYAQIHNHLLKIFHSPTFPSELNYLETLYSKLFILAGTFRRQYFDTSAVSGVNIMVFLPIHLT